MRILEVVEHHARLGGERLGRGVVDLLGGPREEAGCLLAPEERLLGSAASLFVISRTLAKFTLDVQDSDVVAERAWWRTQPCQRKSSTGAVC